MSKLSDQINYLRGLANGMKLNTDKDSNKLILAMLDVMNDMAHEIETVQENAEELSGYVESLDEDLSDLEDAFYEDDDDEEDEEDDEDEAADDDVFGGELISYECPNCGHELTFRASDVDFDEDYRCPACGKPVFPLEDEELAEDDDSDAAEDAEVRPEDPD